VTRSSRLQRLPRTHSLTFAKLDQAPASLRRFAVMASRRIPVSLVAAALALAPAAAAAGFPVAIYPFRVPGLTQAQRADMHSILQAGLASASRRGVLSPRSPVVLPMSCGDVPTPACLGQAAAGGLVLTGRGELRSGMVLVTAALWDSTGARSRELRFVIDLVIQNLRPVGEAIQELEVEVDPDGRIARDDRLPPARDPHGQPARQPSVAAAPTPPPAPAAAPRPPAPAPAARVNVAAPSRAAPPLWKRKAGPWLTGVGAALLAGGAAVGYLNRDLAHELDAKYAGGTLGPGDRAAYDRVKTYNVLSTALFAAGGAAAAAGTWFWVSAPAAPGAVAMVGAEGRF
jgi:hypothetical protein